MRHTIAKLRRPLGTNKPLTATVEGEVWNEVRAELRKHRECDAVEDGLLGAAVDLSVHLVKVVEMQVFTEQLRRVFKGDEAGESVP